MFLSELAKAGPRRKADVLIDAYLQTVPGSPKAQALAFDSCEAHHNGTWCYLTRRDAEKHQKYYRKGRG